MIYDEKYVYIMVHFDKFIGLICNHWLGEVLKYFITLSGQDVFQIMRARCHIIKFLIKSTILIGPWSQTLDLHFHTSDISILIILL